jgi:hypothetical protein
MGGANSQVYTHHPGFESSFTQIWLPIHYYLQHHLRHVKWSLQQLLLLTQAPKAKTPPGAQVLQSATAKSLVCDEGQKLEEFFLDYFSF